MKATATAKICAICGGKLVTRFRLVERMGKTRWRGGRVTRSTVSLYRRARFCASCKVEIRIVHPTGDLLASRPKT